MNTQAALICGFDGADLICKRVYFGHATVLAQLSAK
jgi:hypothetical protein